MLKIGSFYCYSVLEKILENNGADLLISIGWSVIYTAYIASMVYTVDSGTGSTIGSSLRYTPNATAMMDGTNVTAYADWGGIEYTTLNTLRDAELQVCFPLQSMTQQLNILPQRNYYASQFYNYEWFEERLWCEHAIHKQLKDGHCDDRVLVLLLWSESEQDQHFAWITSNYSIRVHYSASVWR
jgi:hypothetical protein